MSEPLDLEALDLRCNSTIREPITQREIGQLIAELRACRVERDMAAMARDALSGQVGAWKARAERAEAEYETAIALVRALTTDYHTCCEQCDCWAAPDGAIRAALDGDQ